jgi:UDP-N-acetylglucosamine 2-epimerase
LATLFFCPTETAVRSLANEGIVRGVHQVGDVMHDSVLFNANLAEERSSIVARLGLEPKSYCLATVHRAENTDEPQRLASILDAFRQLDHPVVLPMHPRTRKTLGAGLDQIGGRIRVIDPLSYLDMLMLERNARIILTDSGGVQKEAYWLAVPCVTLRDETEWVELVDAGWNTIAGAESEAILEAVGRFEAGGPVARKDPPDGLYGNGRSGERIVGVMIDVAGPSATASTWRDTKGKQVSCAEHPPARSSNRAASRLSFIP